MSMFVHSYVVHLDEPLRTRRTEALLLTQDAMSDRVQISVYQGKQPYSLEGGTGTAYVMRRDGRTVVSNKVTIEGNAMWFDLPEEAYGVPGVVIITLKHTVGDVINSLLQLTGTVKQSTTDAIVDPGSEITYRYEDVINALNEAEEVITHVEVATVSETQTYLGIA